MLKKALTVAIALATCAPAWAQSGQLGANQIWGNPTGASAPSKPSNIGSFLTQGTGLTISGTPKATIGITSTIVAAGPSGSATQTPVITYNAQGQLTVVSLATIAPPFSAITGSLACSQRPALTGFVTSPAGSCATSLGATITIAQGGTGQITAAAAISALMPTPTRAGDIAFWNGSNWVTLAGNNSGTQIFSENASGVPAWQVAGTGTVTSAIIAPGTGISATGTCTITITGTCTVGLTKIPYRARATSTFTTDATSSTATVYTGYLTGGGGGGGGSGAAAAAATGGASAGTCSFQFSGVAAGATVTITLGAAGTAGTTVPAAGGAGGSSTIAATGITTITATGGGGGSAAPTTVGGPSTGGSCTTGTSIVSLAGAGGGLGSSASGGSLAGTGAASFWGPGGPGGNVAAGASAGTVGGAPGSGGGGAAGANVAGGAGVAGAALVEWISIQ